ncbi:MAG TPA: hypothetical protein VFW07_09395 [Parafilimonas sp.]|nr:hypothetical protein [Parafilimonas sp.]
MKIQATFTLFFYFSLCAHSDAQFPKSSLGIKSGIVSSYISGLDKTILSEPYFVNYTLKRQNTHGLFLGVFYNRLGYKTPTSEIINENDSNSQKRWLFQAHAEFSEQGSELVLNNHEKDFNYKIIFDYNYISAGFDLKYYFLGKGTDAIINKWRNRFKGLNGGLGFQVGFNTSPDEITYTSWGAGREPVFDSDSLEQKKIRDVLKGKTIAGVNLIAGYDIITVRKGSYVNSGVSIEARVFFGLKDAVETHANPYNFIDNWNMNVVYQLLIGINLYKLVKKK